MTETLLVACDCLNIAGDKLSVLVLPRPRPPVAGFGTDPVSAAIEATMPAIEAPVTDSLPTVQAAVTKTGRSIVAAARMYAETDRSAGEELSTIPSLNTDESLM
ncbi:hypothetical protein [Mycobacterium camsae]|uniref:hypothetical protein n=1 Tax=Mycobacterium gordonae TaxID=1778 RepID=UPI00197FB8E1|nr:hypothetical protein [Mycobacterium gordonae]